jgi:hypothetical protein
MRMQTIAAGYHTDGPGMRCGEGLRGAPCSASQRNGAEMDFRRLQRRAALALIGCRVNVSPPGGTRCRAVATYCTVLQRVPRLEALLRVPTLHECLEGNRLRAERKLQGQWPKVLSFE